jgi:hypothetical protein
MATKFVCDLCKVNECPDYRPETIARIPDGGRLLLRLRADTKHICDGCWRANVRSFAKRYLAEFDFRYNERAALGVTDEARADRLLRGIVGKRLLYKDSSAASVFGQNT